MIKNISSLTDGDIKATALTMSLANQNSLYGSSDTVQPKSLQAQCLIRYE